MILNTQDYNLLQEFGISEQQVFDQIEIFKKGYGQLSIITPAIVGGGIIKLSEIEERKYADLWKESCQKGLKVTKFVPASGAATRMFKSLFEALDTSKQINSDAEQFINNIEKFAFYEELNRLSLEVYGRSIKQLIDDSQHADIISLLLNSKGLDYAALPKGLLKFHKYNTEIRTPFMEHLREGAMYAKDNDANVNLHFTVSEEHLQSFENHFREVIEDYSSKYNVNYKVEFSTQMSSTNTVAVKLDNTLYRDENNRIVFRPAGHGALINNLNEIYSDVIFLKNIDNLCVDNYSQRTIQSKACLGGLLLHYQNKIFSYLKILDEQSNIEHSIIQEIENFLISELNILIRNISELSQTEKIKLFRTILNRPIRVCGMVKNMGEPGGGPFIVQDSKGVASLQILESSQIDDKNLMKNATHFNPVDLVCAVKNYKGEKFNLLEYVDENTGFISIKSIAGEDVKALELPGLWNGAMSKWNTFFVEVPMITFNPVKTVNDLLRQEHR